MKVFLGAVAILVGAAGAARAQPGAPAEGWGLEIGAGALVSPTYEGDDAYRLSLLPNIKITYGDRFFASVQDGVGYNAVNTDRVRAGPIARIRFSRDADGSQPFAVTGARTNDLIGLDDVATTFEVGGFGEIDFGDVTLGVEARQAINGHDGFIADIDVRYRGRVFLFGPPLIYAVGPRAKIVDGSYNDAYFGVTPAQSIISGLPAYDAGGGLHSAGVGATVIAPLTRDNKMAAVLIAGYDRLTGDAGDAPLVRERGSRDQAVIGLFFSYRLF